MAKNISRLDELLAYPSRNFGIREQRAYLLYRNKDFLRDLSKMETYFSIKIRGYQILGSLLKKLAEAKEPIPMNKLGATVSKMVLKEFSRRKWPESDWFYKKWAIMDSWWGDKNGLKANVLAGPLLCGTSLSPKKTGLFPYVAVDTNGIYTYTQSEIYQPSVYILVDPWTTATDVKRLCKFLPGLKESCFGFTTESKRCFPRDLCWYLLTNELKLTPTQIARVWAEKRPDELNALIRKTQEWKHAVDEDKDSVKDEYVRTGLPITVRSAIERTRLMIMSLSRRLPARSVGPIGEEPIPDSRGVLEIGKMRFIATDLAYKSLPAGTRLVEKRGRYRLVNTNSK